MSSFRELVKIKTKAQNVFRVLSLPSLNTIDAKLKHYTLPQSCFEDYEKITV